jgi:glycolate oxidase FAD binding subunit
VVRGAGTKQDWGTPPERVGLVVDLSQMTGVVEHVSDDLVVRARAGTPLASLAATLAGVRQRLPVDEVVAGSTIGGVVATGISGPLRYGHGAVRDLLLGLTVVRADGTVARAGSKVVKNVAGYDLPKLFAGSYGTLGVMTELTFKLRPLPDQRLFVSASYPSPAEMAPHLAELLRSQAVPAAIEIDRAEPDAAVQVCALVEGRPRPAEVRADLLSRVMRDATVSLEAPPWWGSLPGPVTFKLTGAISAVPSLIGQARNCCAAAGLPARLWGSAGTGVLYLGLPSGTDPEQLASILDQLRTAASEAQGHATVLRAPAKSKATLDIWGPVPGLDLMRRVKQRFDPGRLLSPGRFVGGI